MNKEKKLQLDHIHIYFCTLPDLHPVDNTSDFSSLKDSIIKNFELKDRVIDQIDNSDRQVILITFTRMKSLYDPHTYIKLTKHHTRTFTHCSEPLKDFSDYRPYPMVLIGLEDISNVSETQQVYNPENCPKNLYLDPRVKFFDANIWHRYVPLGNGFFEKFQDVLDDIVGNYRNELYQTIVACEYMEFQTRMLRNSFLALIGSEGHGRSVTPFKYHSETLMKKKAQDELEKIKKYASNMKWHFILADDYGDVPLRAKQDRNINQTKKQIIESLINDEQQIAEITNAVESDQLKENIGAIRGSEGVIRATEEKIQEKMYDMILLDYLLGENTEEDCREYGHELLEKIFHAQPGEHIFNNKGPMNYFWIFPISVFSYAILDELYEKGISHFSEHWHLASGADPVNTPQLFRYKLFRFMNMQLREAGVIEEFKAINQNPPLDGENVRNWASEIFGKLLLEFGNKKKLIQDAQSGNSEFAKSVISSHDEIHYYEHLQHLVYLLAYGAGLEWPEMWHEMEYLKSNKKLSDKLSQSFFPVVEKYILALQNQYS